jgi:hypothetical protein
MGTWPRIVVLSCLLTIALYVEATGLAVDDILGAWEVSDVVCSECGDRIPEEKGTIISLGRDRIANPLSEDCVDSVGYDLLEILPSKVFLKRIRAQWPALANRRRNLSKTVLYGFVTCGHINNMQIAFLSKDTAVYFYEGGIAFMLRRARQTGGG